MKKEPKKKMPLEYRIKLKGILPQEWREWFEGLSIAYEGDNTILFGSFTDQSFLHGTLNRIRDLNLVLLSVEALQSENMEELK